MITGAVLMHRLLLLLLQLLSFQKRTTTFRVMVKMTVQSTYLFLEELPVLLIYGNLTVRLHKTSAI